MAGTLGRNMGGRLRAVYWEINIWVQIPYLKPETFSVFKILSLWACGCQGSDHFLYLKPDPCFAHNVVFLRQKLQPLSDYKTMPVFVAILFAARCFFVAPATPKPLKRYRKLPSRTHSGFRTQTHQIGWFALRCLGHRRSSFSRHGYAHNFSARLSRKSRPKRMVERVVLSLLSVGIYTMANASLVQAWARSGPLRAAAAVAHHIGRNRACVQQVICASWLRI